MENDGPGKVVLASPFLWVKAVPSNNGIENALEQMEEDYDFMSPFLGELSIGYAF